MTLRVSVLRSAESAANSSAGPIVRQRAFKLAPEFKVPTLAKAAVADFQTERRSDDGEWVWDDSNAYTLHPFWVVRRLTQQQLQKERNEVKPGEWSPRFTCAIEYFDISEVCVYTMAECDNRTKSFKVPFITITDAMGEGEELILKSNGKDTKTGKKRTWRDVEKEDKQKKHTKRTPRENTFPQ